MAAPNTTGAPITSAAAAMTNAPAKVTVAARAPVLESEGISSELDSRPLGLSLNPIQCAHSPISPADTRLSPAHALHTPDLPPPQSVPAGRTPDCAEAPRVASPALDTKPGARAPTMPAPDQEPSPGNATGLPSFYSPRPNARDTSHNDGDVEQADFSVSADKPASSSSVADGEADAPPGLPSAQLTEPPPASLLSPAFTPPSTPGSATPSNAEAALTSEPRGVPVDSSIPTGGCGAKHPQLLETLPQVECIVRARIPTTTGAEMFLHLYTNNVDNKEHLAIVFGGNIRSKSLDAVREGETEMDRLVRGAYTGRLYPGRTTSGLSGDPSGSQGAPAGEPQDLGPPLVRIHSECYTGETVWSARCDCGEQLDEAARLMSLPGNKAGGIIIYLRQEGRGIGLGEKLKAYNLQDLGSDTVEANLLLRHPADARSYGLATAMLLDLGQKEIRLLTNNPDKIRAVEGPNREVVVKERVAMVPLSWKGKGGFRAPEVEGYLKTKVRPPSPDRSIEAQTTEADTAQIEKMGHMLDLGALPR